MRLNHSQKNFIKKNIKKLSLGQIAQRLALPENVVVEYLKKRWGEDKFRKYIKSYQFEREKEKPMIANCQLADFKRFIRNNLWHFLILALLVLIAYFNSLNNVFLSDDIAAIRDNPNLGNFKDIFTQDLTWMRHLVYFVAYHIKGANPMVFRLFNIFFHLGSVWLLYIIVSVLTSKQLLAFLTASIFAVHPILTESVTWISGGPYSQYSFFLLFSFLIYILSQNNKKLYLASIFLFILALLSSEKSMAFPFVILIFEISLNNIKKHWKKLIPFFLLGGGWILVNVLKIGMRISVLQAEYYQKPHLMNPLVQIPTAITTYLQLIFWPDKLTLYHSELSFSPFEYSLRLIITILFFGSLFFFYKKNRLLFFWLTFFVISLSPTLTPLPIAWIVAERYVYLGSAGIFFIISYFLVKLIQNRKLESFGYILVVLILFLLTTRTIIRNIDWKNEDNLWLALSKTSPSDPKTHNNLGDMYSRHNDLLKAEEEFKKAIKLLPDYADAYHNLANTYFKMGKVEEALKNYQKAIKYNPRLWQSYQNISLIYFEQKKFQLAEEAMKKAIAISSTNPNLYVYLGIIYLNVGNREKAQESLTTALKLDPGNKNAQEMLSRLK